MTYIGQSNAIALPRRPGFGTQGRRIQLTTNFFEVKLPRDMTIYHYDVEIQPKIPRKLKQKVMQEAIKASPKFFSGHRPVFDGEKSMYCHKRLPADQNKVMNSNIERNVTTQKDTMQSMCQCHVTGDMCRELQATT